MKFKYIDRATGLFHGFLESKRQQLLSDNNELREEGLEIIPSETLPIPEQSYRVGTYLIRITGKSMTTELVYCEIINDSFVFLGYKSHNRKIGLPERLYLYDDAHLKLTQKESEFLLRCPLKWLSKRAKSIRYSLELLGLYRRALTTTFVEMSKM